MSEHIPYINEFVTVGINHWNASVKVRERFSLTSSNRDAFLDDAAAYGLRDLIILSTCNRTELFARCKEEGVLAKFLIEHSSGTKEEFDKYGFTKRGEKAIQHFFNVAIGLDAQILGDLQIIKQVKEAYEAAVNKDLVDSLMHRLMQSVFRTHKRTRNETDLASGAATVAYAAVQAAKQRLGSLADKTIVLVGTGKIGKVTCKNLINMGARQVTLINRNRNRAENLGDRYELPVAEMDEMESYIANADLVIVATGAAKPVITTRHVPTYSEGRKLVMLDLSVPRNIAPELDHLPHVELVNMDMLNERTDEAYKKRQECIPQAEAIIQEEIEDFKAWLDQQKVVPTIKSFTEKLENIRNSEVERFRNKLSEDQLADMDLLTQRIVNKIAAYSIEHLRNSNGKSEDVAKLVHEMFKLEKEK